MGTPNDDDAPMAGPDSLASSFQRELAQRAGESQQEVSTSDFDGQALLDLLRARYGRSYDVSLVQRQYLGQNFVALNIMWKYAEQQSWTVRVCAAAVCLQYSNCKSRYTQYTEEEYMERLDYVAAALRAWGKVKLVQDDIMARKERPRVGKAVSVMLDLDEVQWREWFLI